MAIRCACLLGVLTLLPCVSPEASAASPEERRLVVVEAPGNVLTQTARERLQEAVAEVAAGHGIGLAPAASLPAHLRSCALPACLPSVAAASGAIFVLRVEAKFVKESFTLAVELWNSDSAKRLGVDGRDCPICDEPDLWGSAALLTKGLLDHALREPAKPAPSPAVVQATQVQVEAVPPLTTTGQAGRSSRTATYSGLALAVTGLAAIGVGAYYVSVDGESVGKESDRVRDTMKLGVPVTVGGGLALLAGAGLMAWSFWSAPAEVAIGPSGVRVTGRF